MEKKRLLAVPITHSPFTAVSDAILTAARQRRSAFVCFANAHMLVEAQRDRVFRRMLYHAWIVAPDGKPLSILMRWLYGVSQEQVAGPDLMRNILERAAREKIPLFFYGSTPDTLNKLVSKAAQEYPDLPIAGFNSPPFSIDLDREDLSIDALINESGAQIVLVALGCPKQERWMYRHSDNIRAVLLGVGAAFNFYTEELPRAPLWMRNNALEWLYRLMREPRRLWKRYLVTNPLFLFFAAIQLLQQGMKTSCSRHEADSDGIPCEESSG